MSFNKKKKKKLRSENDNYRNVRNQNFKDKNQVKFQGC